MPPGNSYQIHAAATLYKLKKCIIELHETLTDNVGEKMANDYTFALAQDALSQLHVRVSEWTPKQLGAFEEDTWGDPPIHWLPQGSRAGSQYDINKAIEDIYVYVAEKTGKEARDGHLAGSGLHTGGDPGH
jgi:hypothetical protein